MTTTDSAVRVRIAQFSAQIIANNPTMADWVRRYFGPWWQVDVEPVTAGAADVSVLAQVDHTRYAEISSAVDAVPYETTSYGRQEMRFVRTGGALTAYTPDGVAYTVTDGSIAVAGTDPVAVAMSACRLARAALRGALARDGWVLLHASAVVREGRAHLAFGPKGAGKTAIALQLASATGGAVLANDRVFTRPDADGTVIVLPWPAAVSIGLGLLDSAGWYEAVAAARYELYPSTPASVLHALGRGEREPVHEDRRQRKARLYPHQLTTLLGVPLATSAAAGALLFPTVDPAAGGASLEPGGRDIGVDDTFGSAHDGGCPNVFGLHEPEIGAARDAVFRALNALPRWAITLTHDVGSNLTLLGEVRS